MFDTASDVAFTPTVKEIQRQKGSRDSYARMENRGGWQREVTSDLRAFLSLQDMFYLGTANASGQPYIQYRGGSPGFLRVLGPTTLGFADFAGNQQYITLGNLSENPQAFIFLMDYVHRKRIKIWGTARVLEEDAKSIRAVTMADDSSRVERAIVFEIEAWDINCPQHIHRRLPAIPMEAHINELEDRIAELTRRLNAAQVQHGHHDHGVSRPASGDQP